MHADHYDDATAVAMNATVVAAVAATADIHAPPCLCCYLMAFP